MRRAQPKLILTLGAHADGSPPTTAPAGVPVVNLAPFQPTNPAGGWQPALNALQALTFPRDVPAGPYAGGREPIPRADLPFGTLRWQATTGNRAQQGKVADSPSPNYFQLRMPAWAAKSSPTALTTAEAAAVAALKAQP